MIRLHETWSFDTNNVHKLEALVEGFIKLVSVVTFLFWLAGGQEEGSCGQSHFVPQAAKTVSAGLVHTALRSDLFPRSDLEALLSLK